MRSITATCVLQRNIEDVWRSLTQPSFGAVLSQVFDPSAFGYQAKFTGPGSDISSDTVVEKGTIEVINRRGRHVAYLHVDELRPPGVYVLTNIGPDGQREGTHVFKTTFDLLEYGEGRTRVNATMVVILKNGFFEFLTLMMPIGWIYVLCLRSAIKKLTR